jgi:serine/threonine-protein kinase
MTEPALATDVTRPGATLDLDTFTQTLRSLGHAPEQLRLDEKGTIYDSVPAVDLARRELPVVLGGGTSDDLVLQGQLSRGGMGEILLATQLSLDRVVAVKRPLDADREAAEREIIVEARVSGALEHPNIVPVHVLGKDANGQPLLVMKRIEGKTWAQLMREGPDIGRDVDILMNVCRALHFAHSRGVVHRDVKPANVMVGRFGEVYLLDWGIAVGLDATSILGLRAARAVRGIAGTPQYMAPEMALPVAPVDARTDVYLLGAVLHEVLTGRPPHVGATVAEMIHNAYLAHEPVFDHDAPEDLVEICRRAMKRDPAERFTSAEEMRLALARFEGRRAARELIAEALARLETLKELPLDVEPARLQRTFNECRFGFEQALRVWPDSQRARDGLEQCLTVMCRHEVNAGHLDSARLLAAELDDVPSELADALRELEKKRALEMGSAMALKQLEREKDAKLSERARGFVALVAGLSYLVLALFMAFLVERKIYDDVIGVYAVFSSTLAVAIFLLYRFDPRVSQNEIGRGATRAMVLTSTVLGLWYASARILGADAVTTIAASQAILAMSLAVTSSFHPGLGRAVATCCVSVPLVFVAARFGLPWVIAVSGIGGAVSLMLMPAWLEPRPPATGR